MALIDDRPIQTGAVEAEAVRSGSSQNSRLPLLVSYPDMRRGNPLSGSFHDSSVRTRNFTSNFSNQLYLITKRIGDVIVASTALILLSPLLLMVALIIFLQDRGPIFFCQTRIGRNGQPFRFYKFRSMVRNAEALKQQLAAHNEASGPIFKMKNDPRITPIGRWIRRYSVDEMPQLFNVLRGDMSLIGPRPHLPSEVAKYTERQKLRLSVQPGLLCLREIQGRSNLTFERWIETDLIYVECRSFTTDLKILLHTIPAVLKADGAY